jgi:hypothetical protein
MMGDVPQIQRIVGDVPLNPLNSFQYNVDVIRYGAGIKVEDHMMRKNILSDQVNAAIRQLPQRQAQHVSELILGTTLPGLKTTIGLDGVPFYSATHPVDGGTQSNLSTGNTIVAIAKPTLTEAATIFDIGRIGLMKMKSDTGYDINAQVAGYTLFCPVEWHDVFVTLFDQSTEVISATSNSYRKYNVDVQATTKKAASGTVTIDLWAHGPGIQAQTAFVDYDPAHLGSDMDVANEWWRFVTSGRYNVSGYKYEGMFATDITQAA